MASLSVALLCAALTGANARWTTMENPDYPPYIEHTLEKGVDIIVVETRSPEGQIITKVGSDARYKVLGQGAKWKGYQTKLDIFKEYLVKQNETHPHRLVIFLDTDVGILPTCDDKKIIEKYHSVRRRSGASIIFGAEMTYFEVDERLPEIPPIPHWALKDNPKLDDADFVSQFWDEAEEDLIKCYCDSQGRENLKFQNLNSGTFIGTNSDVLKMVSDVLIEYNKLLDNETALALYRKKWHYDGYDGPGDQKFYWNYFLDNQHFLTLDYESTLFQCTQMFDPLKMFKLDNRGTLRSALTNLETCIVHFQGTAKDNVFPQLSFVFKYLPEIKNMQTDDLLEIAGTSASSSAFPTSGADTTTEIPPPPLAPAALIAPVQEPDTHSVLSGPVNSNESASEQGSSVIERDFSPADSPVINMVPLNTRNLHPA